MSDPKKPPTYDAFLSYSHAADARFAPFLQGAVQSFARPWYKLRSVRIFRDQTGLNLTPELWPEIAGAIDASRFFILLASPEAAASEWVRQEIAHWLTLARTPPLIVVTGGSIAWDAQTGDFDWVKTTALPRTLADVYRHEPLYLNATAIKAEDLSQRHAKIRSASAQIYSRLAGRPLDDVIGADVRVHRRNQLSAGIALAVLAALGALYLWQRAETRRQEAIAAARRQLEVARSLASESVSRNGGPEAVNVSEREAQQAAMLAVESVNLVPTVEGNDALHRHLALIPDMAGERKLPDGVITAALSGDGESLAVRLGRTRVSMLSAIGGGSATVSIADGANSDQLRLANGGRLFGLGPHRLSDLQSGKSWGIDAADASAFRMSPNGDLYATVTRASEKSETVVALWRTGGPTAKGRWSIGRPLSSPLAFSHNGAFLAFVNGGVVDVVDVSTGRMRHSEDTELTEITALAVDDSGDAVLVLGWAPDPRYIVQKNFIVRSFPTTGHSTFRPIYYQSGSDLGIRNLAINTSAGVVAYGGGTPGWVEIKDYAGTGTLAIIRDDGLADWTMTSKEGNVVVTTASLGQVRRWKIRREAPEAIGARRVAQADIGPQAALSGSGKRLAVGAIDRKTREGFVAVVDEESGKQLLMRASPALPEKLLLSPDGTMLAIWTGGVQVVSVADGRVLWQTADRPVPQADRAPLYLAFSPDSKYLTWGRSSDGVFVRALATQRERIVSGPVQGLLAVAIASGGRETAWAADAGQPGTDGSCPCVAVAIQASPSAKIQTLSTLGAPPHGAKVSVALAFDSAGQRVAVGVSHGSMGVFDVRGRPPVLSLFHEGEVHSIAFHEDGQYLLTTGTGRLLDNAEESEAVVWSVAEGRQLWRRLTKESIYGFAMTPDDGCVALVYGTNVQSTGYLGIATEKLYWHAHDLVRLACRMVPYRLTTEERRAFLSDLSAPPCPVPH
jgi:WD40 repeat protein